MNADEHGKLWWNTYNAFLPLAYKIIKDIKWTDFEEEIHDLCVEFANHAHGKIEK